MNDINAIFEKVKAQAKALNIPFSTNIAPNVEINTRAVQQKMEKNFIIEGEIMENRNGLICPVCGAGLVYADKTYRCKNGHAYDQARQGYVNLLPVQSKHSLHPGDTKEMLLARRAFLNGGYYQPIAESVVQALEQYLPESPSLLLDVGCGEGYYTAYMEKKLGISCIGADISKDGVKMACSRNKSIQWIVATASHLPLADNTADAVTAMFALFLPDEYARVLKKGGIVVEVTVASEHLHEMKNIIYNEVFPQEKYPAPCGEKFEELSCEKHTFQCSLDNTALVHLLRMTPHFWRIHQERREQLEKTEGLTITAAYWVRVLRKK